MTGKPGDPESESPGGHAADRLREFMEQRLPQAPQTDEATPEQGAANDAGRDHDTPADSDEVS